MRLFFVLPHCHICGLALTASTRLWRIARLSCIFDLTD